MLAPVQITQETYRLQKQWYPRALLFGVLFARKLFALVMTEAHHTLVQPTKAVLIVMQQLLSRDVIEGDFRLALRQQVIDNAESPQVAPLVVPSLVVQGYVDFITLAWATISAAVDDVEPEQMYGALDQLLAPEFAEYPCFPRLAPHPP
jgi:hypothetical protein